MRSKFIYWVFDKYLNRKDCDKLKKLGKNLSTIKSQIRNSRALLIKSTEEDFRRIDELYM